MERKGLLFAMLNLIVTLGLAAVPATAKPRHHRHHATAISAEKGGDKGPSDNSGKGSDKGEDHGNGQGNGSGQGNGNGNGNAASQGNVDSNGNGQGNGKPDDSSDAGPGNDNSP